MQSSNARTGWARGALPPGPPPIFSRSVNRGRADHPHLLLLALQKNFTIRHHCNQFTLYRVTFQSFFPSFLHFSYSYGWKYCNQASIFYIDHFIFAMDLAHKWGERCLFPTFILYTEIWIPQQPIKKRVKHEKKNYLLFYATFQCGRCNVFKKKILPMKT